MREDHLGRILELANTTAGVIARSTRTGNRPFVILAVLITLCAVVGHGWWAQSRRYGEQHREELLALLDAKVEPNRESVRPTLLTATLNLDFIEDLQCDLATSTDGIAPCPSTSALLAAAEHLDDSIDSGPQLRRGSFRRASEEVQRAAGRTPSATRARHQAGRLQQRWDETLDGTSELLPCRHLWRDAQRVQGETAYCSPEARSILVPSFLSDQLTRENVQAGVRLASLLDALIPSYFQTEGSGVGRSTATTGENARLIRPARVVQSFYVDRSGVLAIWNSQRETASAEHKPYVDLRTSSYLQYFIKEPGETRYATLPYIDLGGFGVVRTLCARMGSETPNHLVDAQAVGAFCVDYSLPISRPSTPRHRGAVFDYAVVSVSHQTHDVSYEVPPETAFSRRVLDEVRDTFLSADADGRSQVRQRISELSDHVYSVPLHRDASGILVALVRAKEPPAPVLLYTLTVLLVLTIGAFVWATVQRRRDRVVLLQEGILRNLQVGVIRTSMSKSIVFANDRAEELMDRCIRSSDDFGEPRTGPLLDDVFESEGLDEQLLKLVSVDEVYRARQRGEHTRYYLRLRAGRNKLGHRWVVIHGTPELFVHVHRDRGTFGILSVPGHDDDVLDSILNSLSERHDR